MTDYTMSEQRTRIHPYKFNMWIGMGSIVMFFAGFTSAYIVMRGNAGWESFSLPRIFWFSTAVILASSYTMHRSLREFRERRLGRYKGMITLTAALGVIFLVSQTLGFVYLYSRGIKLTWNVSAGLLFVITGMHMIHVLGGVVAILVIFARAYRKNIRNYSAVPVEIVATYWHFVDALWIYLYVFFIIIH
jgi:cytochrome c oxidase subunit 3